MSLRPAGVGAEPKKMMVLAGIVLVGGGVVYWANKSDAPAGASAPPASSVKNPALPASTPAPARTTASSGGTSVYATRSAGRRGSTSAEDFRPTLKLPEGLDVSRIDPTLRLDLLAKVRQVSAEGGSRSLFEFYTPPPPPVTPPKVDPIKPLAAKPEGPPPPPAGPRPPPPPPPIPLKFYGYSGAVRSNVRKAFFLDGEDIVQAGENDTIRNRYKIVRIGVNSAEVEDIVAKNKQTLPLAEEAQ
jgi:hypothetical protein